MPEPLVFPAVIVARMNSKRLAGKALLNVAGKKLIQYVIETLRQTDRVGQILIATSQETSDDALVDFSSAIDVRCVRGSLDDVAARFFDAMQKAGSEAAFRVNGDSPLVSRTLLDMAAGEYERGHFDLVTNVFPRTFPPGVSVELVRRDAFAKALSRMREPSDREHVTRYMYSHADQFRIKNLAGDRDLSACHLAVDTPHDMQVFEAMVSQMTRPHWDYEVEELAALYHAVVQHVSG